MGAFSYLIKSVLRYLESAEARADFIARKVGKQNKLDQVEMEAEADLEIENESRKLNNLMDSTSNSKLHKQFNQEISGERREKAEAFKKLFEPDTPVNITKTINEYLRSEAVRKLHTSLKSSAEGTYVPNREEMNYMIL